MIPAEFMAAILAAPKDDLPRLIVADFLDEHGESERAAFIRVQVELHSLEGVLLANDRRRELQRRERELLFGVRDAWFPIIVGWITTLGPIVPNPHRGTMLATRGFISQIACSWPDWLTHHAAILKATPLERVVLTTMPDGLSNVRLDDTQLVVNDRLIVHDEFGDLLFPGIEFELPQPRYAIDV